MEKKTKYFSTWGWYLPEENITDLKVKPSEKWEKSQYNILAGAERMYPIYGSCLEESKWKKKEAPPKYKVWKTPLY